MELIIKHIIYALYGLEVTQRSFYGACKLSGSVQNVAPTNEKATGGYRLLASCLLCGFVPQHLLELIFPDQSVGQKRCV